MQKRKKWAIATVIATMITLGAGVASISVQADESLNNFDISAVSVRVNSKTDEYGRDTSGIRFKTDAKGLKEQYPNAKFYTKLTVKGESPEVKR